MARRKAVTTNTEVVTEITVKTDDVKDIKNLKDGKDLGEIPEPKKVEVLYSAAELAENAEKLFQAKPECVYGAFKAAGLKEATVKQAKSLVKGFLNKAIN